MKKALTILSLFGFVVATAVSAQAYEIPSDNTQVKYFYVFGPEGDSLMGKEDAKQEIFIDVPSGASEVSIGVFDPDTGDFVDWRTDVNTNEWDTTTKFTVYGESMLDSETFGQDANQDRKYHVFGPYNASQGKSVEVGKRRFKLVAEGISGDDQNLFKVMVSPDSAESFVTDMTFRLLPHEGDEMTFYPEVASGISGLKIENYDLDAEGGSSVLLEGAMMRKHAINDSKSGEWSATDVALDVQQGGRLRYVITKATQRHANAGLRITDSNGDAVRIYFRRGAPVVTAPKPMPKPMKKAPSTKCNTYTFDARSSYDGDNQALEYLWDFGDGTTSTEAYTTHTYAEAGAYDVVLTVTDNSGLECDTAVSTDKVMVNTPPTAVLDAPASVCADQAVTISASGSTDDTPSNLTYNWSLGDGSTEEGSIVSKTYSKGGTYKVKLMVDDNANTACSTDSAEKMIKVNTEPKADAGKDITVCESSMVESFKVHLDASSSSDADGDKLTYTWDFGDGNSGSGKSVTHEYAQAGSYRASVYVDDQSGLSCSSSIDLVDIELNRKPKAMAGDDVVVCQDTTVTFDASGSSDDESLKYSWNFGDGNTGSGSVVTHTYSKPGNYQASLTVDDGRGMACSMAKDELSVKINSGPTVSLDDAEKACVGDTVSFKAMANDADGDSLKYTWDFGDGTVKSGGSSVSHTYKEGGFYAVEVTVDDGKGMSCSVASDTAYVDINSKPVADAGDNLTCCVDKTTAFDGSGSSDPDGDTLSYTWDFGDGSGAEGATTSHAYGENGKYKVILRVNDNEGTKCSEDTDGFVAEVNQKPVPVIKIS